MRSPFFTKPIDFYAEKVYNIVGNGGDRSLKR